MYGTQANWEDMYCTFRFENDVNMYGTQADEDGKTTPVGLRMM